MSLGHGCGAHSEAVVIPAMAERPEPVVDEVGFETVEREPREEGSPEAAPDDTAVTAELAVELGHG